MSTSATSQEARFIADALAAEADAVQRLATRVAAGGAGRPWRLAISAAWRRVKAISWGFQGLVR